MMSANVAGTMRPIVARISEAAFMPTTSWSYCCTPFLRPPTSSDAPSTSSRLPMIEPVIDAWTTSIWPSRIRNAAMMISPMLPTVAFMIPPILGPAEMPSCSVAWPRR